MSEHLRNYNLLNNFQFDYSIPPTTNHELLVNQQRRIPLNDYQIYPTITTPYYLPPISLHEKVLDQSKQQWENDVSQSAIIINEKQIIIPSPMNNSADYHSISSQSDDQTPTTHIVSPEAIREALKEETEEAMGHNQRRRPFSKFTSFHDLKQRLYSTIETNTKYDDNSGQKYPDEPETPCPSHRPKATLEKLKRPPNAYLLFNRDMRRKLLRQSPKMTVAEISKKVGNWWKALPDAKRACYVKEAAILKEEHLKKYPDFIYTRRSKAQLAEAKKTSKLGRKVKSETIQKYGFATTATTADTTTATATTDTTTTTITTTYTTVADKKRSTKFSTKGGLKDPRGRKKKRHKHPFAPKHPMSAYLHYLASVYPQVSLNFPGSTVGPISKSISKTWHAMSPEERLPWKQKADSDKARYAREMQVYHSLTLAGDITNAPQFDA